VWLFDRGTTEEYARVSRRPRNGKSVDDEQPQEDVSIGKEAEAAAQAERKRLFESRTPRLSDLSATAQLAESIGRALGLEADKVSGELADRIHALREQLTSHEPPPLEESRTPRTGE
jgi:hypothetical protein